MSYHSFKLLFLFFQIFTRRSLKKFENEKWPMAGYLPLLAIGHLKVVVMLFENIFSLKSLAKDIFTSKNNINNTNQYEFVCVPVEAKVSRNIYHNNDTCIPDCEFSHAYWKPACSRKFCHSEDNVVLFYPQDSCVSVDAWQDSKMLNIFFHTLDTRVLRQDHPAPKFLLQIPPHRLIIQSFYLFLLSFFLFLDIRCSHHFHHLDYHYFPLFLLLNKRTLVYSDFLIREFHVRSQSFRKIISFFLASRVRQRFLVLDVRAKIARALCIVENIYRPPAAVVAAAAAVAAEDDDGDDDNDDDDWDDPKRLVEGTNKFHRWEAWSLDEWGYLLLQPNLLLPILSSCKVPRDNRMTFRWRSHSRRPRSADRRRIVPVENHVPDCTLYDRRNKKINLVGYLYRRFNINFSFLKYQGRVYVNNFVSFLLVKTNEWFYDENSNMN